MLKVEYRICDFRSPVSSLFRSPRYLEQFSDTISLWISGTWIFKVIWKLANPSDRAVKAVGLRPLACWDCVRIPPGAWMFVCCECCVLSDRGLCDELITRPEESCRLWCVVLCDLETSEIGRPWPTGGLSRHKNLIIYAYWTWLTVRIAHRRRQCWI